MKNILNRLSLSLMFLGLVGTSEFVSADSINAFNGIPFVFNGNIVNIWQDRNETGRVSVYGAVGTIESSRFEVTALSEAIASEFETFRPTLYSNIRGDVVVLWSYLDYNSNYWIAAATLPVGGSWTISTISAAGVNGCFLNERASVDEQGNIVALWTALDLVGHSHIYSAIGNIDGTWNQPYNLVP